MQQEHATVPFTDRLARWQRDGYLVLPGFEPAAKLAALRARSLAIVEALDPGADAAVFSSRDRRRLADRSLLESADKVCRRRSKSDPPLE